MSRDPHSPPTFPDPPEIEMPDLTGHEDGEAFVIDGHRLPTVHVKRPRCPMCNGIDVRSYRSRRDIGGGIGVSYMQCLDRSCRTRFRLVRT